MGPSILPTNRSEDEHPRQGDDEDDPAPLPMPRTSIVPPGSRGLVWSMIALGALGVAIGLLSPDAKVEVLLGALLLLLGLRALIRSTASRSRVTPPS